MGLKGSLRNVSTGVPPIPDSEVYLHDDWGDNRLTDRENSGTTTHNGVEGVYRPEWTVDSDNGFNEPTVQNESLEIVGNDGIYTDINLNLDETITWEIDAGIFDDGSSGGDATYIHLFAEQTSEETDDRYHRSYVLEARGDGREESLFEIDDSGNVDILIRDASANAERDYVITREPDGTWELIVNGVSQGTNTDVSHTTPAVTGIIGSDGTDAEIYEYKVS